MDYPENSHAAFLQSSFEYFMTVFGFSLFTTGIHMCSDVVADAHWDGVESSIKSSTLNSNPIPLFTQGFDLAILR